ncbi:PE-PPE domain-containing protein [Mycobacterium sp. ITM-2016-00317]|uniref:PE-PPE domain-containing protein n=1 Tax=Mycobacterium sp. ITM-2016-00317 TaxID=2099694 RepID=UPI00287F9086|nr:PE-PPE domain-containing protein [Mycobacterium sp. ITM-2016-00317]WNG85288.1 PE-PPE domain-containing protein [Mycobacterium sp. ITM-2016-00317]
MLTVTGYTAGGTLQWDMSEAFQGHYCDADSGNTCTPVRYLSGLPLVGESDGLRALRSAIKTSTGPTVVLGYSQGALIAADWLAENEDASDRPSPEDLSFVLFGNSLRKYGGVRPAYDIDPPMPNSDYHVTDIAIEYDGAADFPDDPFNLLALANAFAGFQYVHIYGYEDVDLENDEKLVWTDGNVTYVLIRQQNIPLLEPLRRLGLHELADQLNGPLKEIIDSAYDRDYPGLVDSTSEDVSAQVISADTAEMADEVTDDAATVEVASSRSQRSHDDAEDAEGAAEDEPAPLIEDLDEYPPSADDSDDSAAEDDEDDALTEIPDAATSDDVPVDVPDDAADDGSATETGSGPASDSGSDSGSDDAAE